MIELNKAVGATLVLADRSKIDVKARELFNKGFRFCASAAVDERPLGKGFSHNYIFHSKSEGDLVLRVELPSFKPVQKSISKVIPGAEWAEREARDLLGIEFEGLPPGKLVLPENWPEGVFPLRKEFNYCERPLVEGEFKAREKETTLPIGPYHPALHEPESFRIYVKGEEIVDAEYIGFLVHRGIEKTAEGRLTYNQVPFIAERICGICGFIHSTLYCEAIEKAAEVGVPEKASYIRTLMLELERIHSHLLWLGVLCHLAGFDVGFMHAWRIRESIMCLAERLSGSRKTYGLNLIGGVRRDVDRENASKALEIVKSVKVDFKDFVEMIKSNRSLIERLENIGVLSRDDARKLCVVGPTARGSGIDIDVRRDSPYEAYKELSFKVPVYLEGDVLARTLVRIDEILESISLVEQVLAGLPSGPIMAEVTGFDIPAYTVSLAAGEAPRGEDIHFLITGVGRVYRWKVRAPTYNNLPSVPLMLKGNTIADAPLIIASIDPCFSCTDRTVIVDVSERVGGG